MRILSALTLLAFAAAVGLGQEGGESPEITPYSVTEIENFLHSFKSTYRKGAPEEDAIAVLPNLRKAYKYIESKGDEATKEERKAQKQIVSMISKGLKARRRPLVTVECARTLGEIGDPSSARDLSRWLEKVLDEKSPHPQWVEYGFLSLAWIGPQDKQSLDLVIKYAGGKHLEETVAAHAMRACYEWKALKPKNRVEVFKKVLQRMQSLWSQWKTGDKKRRHIYERQYKAVEKPGLRALGELAGGGVTFKNPVKATEWWNENKKRRWEPYVGPHFRKKPATPAEEAPAAGEKPAGEGEESS